MRTCLFAPILPARSTRAPVDASKGAATKLGALTALLLGASLAAGAPARAADAPAPAPAPTAAPAAAPAPAPAAAPITLELNKLEVLAQGGPGCRAYFVVANADAKPIPQYRVDLILFGTDGVIARRLAFDLSPLAARKTAVRLFDLQGLPCDQIDHLLVNDVLACQTGEDSGTPTDQQRQACLDRLTVSSRAKAQLTK
ncbi:MAG: Tat pathway signal protein [Acetobacteraceae bacterium]